MKHSQRRTAGALALGLALSACGGGGGSDSSSSTIAVPTTAKAGGSGGQTDGSTSTGSKTGKVRVVNAFAPGGVDTTTLDLYDTPNPGKDDKPLIEGLAYGEVSDYVQPKALGDAGNLYLFEAGHTERSTTGSSQDIDGQAISNAGFDKGTQRTVVIGTTNAFDDDTKDQPIYSEIMEEGTGNLAPTASQQPDPDKGLLLVSPRGAETDRSKVDYYLAVDGSCPARRDPENAVGGSVEVLANANAVPFLVAPGRHDLQLLEAPEDNGLTTCDLSAAKADATADVDAGGRVEVFAIAPGDEPASWKLVVAPVPG